jgi:capsular exopolysaccharide synthesis family protein
VTADERVKLSAHELLSSPLLGALRQRFEDVTRERDGLRGRGLGENHPEFKEADLKVLAAREAVLAEVRNIQGSVERDLAVVKRQEAGLLGLVERAKAQALELNLLDIEFSRLRRSKESTEKLHALLLERTTETDLQRRLRVNNIHVVEYPLLPSVHVYPRFSIFFALGALLGVVLGFVVALLRVALDRTIKTPDDVERYLRQTFLGLLPMADQVSVRAEPYRRRGRRPKPDKEIPPELVVHHFPMSSFAESARVVRTNLMFMSPDKPHRVLLVTSAGPEEGKTTVACGIALAMAQAGKRVCLVDCDLRRSRLHHVFRRPSDQGLTTFLVEDRIPSEEDLATDIPRLGVLCAGPHPPNPAEIVHSERFRALLEALAERYDRVVIDSPPLVAVTDAAIISTVVDATVLVVRAFRSRRELARHAVRTLRDLDSNVLGVILNAVDFARREYKYDYYYRSYAKDYYYRREGEDAEDRGSGEIEPRSDSQPQAP